MKKVKIMLITISIFAIAGGVFAFKSKGFTLYCSTIEATSGCPNSIVFPASTFTESAIGQSFCTINSSGTCDVRVTNLRQNN